MTAVHSNTTTLEFDVKLQALRWNQQELGSLSIIVREFGILFEKTDNSINTWATIPTNGRPDRIEVDINYHLDSGVQLFHMIERQVRPIKGRIPTLMVPVVWMEKKRKGDKGKEETYHVPSTRSKHKDNIDLVMCNENGGFVMVEVAVVTRDGRFLLTLQEVYAGQVVHTNAAAAKKLGQKYVPLNGGEGLVGTVLPLWDHNAYPGNDFVRTWEKEACVLLPIFHDSGRSLPLSKTEAAKWDPPVRLGIPKKAEEDEIQRIRGVCTFFNIAGGYGFIRDPSEDNNYFVHFSDIKGGLFALLPMKAYEFTPVRANDKYQAFEVRRT